MASSPISESEPLPQSLLFFISNVHHLIPLKLNQYNYSIWKLQCQGALKACSLFDYVKGSQSPSPTIEDSNGNSIPNPDYFSWFVVESHLRSCLISTLSPPIFAQVTHTRTALELCQFLKHKFAKSNGNLGSGSNAIKVFDESPNREFLAIADDSNVTPPLPNGMSHLSASTTVTRRLFEQDMLVLNQSDSRFVKDGLALPREEMIGQQTCRGGGSPERLPFQQKSGPHISTQADQEMNHSGSKETAPTPYCATDLSSDSLKKNNMALFCTPCQVSRLWASKPDTSKNNENRGSSKETGNAAEHTLSTNNREIQNLEDAGLKGKPLPVYEKVNGGNTFVLMGSNGNNKTHISRGTEVEGDLLQVNKTLNEAKVIESMGTTDDQMIQNTHKRKLEGESLQVNKKLNGGNPIRLTGTTDSQNIENSLQRNPEGKSMEIYGQSSGGNAIEIKRTIDEHKISKKGKIGADRAQRGQGKGRVLGMGNPGGKAKGALRKYECKRCGKDHPGVECDGKKVECFSCGKLGHRAFECRVDKSKKGKGKTWNNFPMPNQIGRPFHGRGNFQGQVTQSSVNQARAVPSRTGENAEGPMARSIGNHLGTMDERTTYRQVEDIVEVAGTSITPAAGGQVHPLSRAQAETTDNVVIGIGNRGLRAHRALRKYICKRCGKDHPGVECDGKKVECFSCGKLGHRAFECRVGKSGKGKTRNKFPMPNQIGGQFQGGGNIQGHVAHSSVNHAQAVLVLAGGNARGHVAISSGNHLGTVDESTTYRPVEDTREVAATSITPDVGGGSTY